MSAQGDHNLELARQSLSTLLDDKRLPKAVREALASDYEEVRAMLDKIEQGHLHVAAFGRVSTGKSSLLNALVGTEVFSVSPLHGETKQASIAQLEMRSAGGVFVIDTPGIDEADGESRESIANEVARRADIILFTVDSDLTETEFQALGELTALGPPVLLVLNKMDQYTSQELEILLDALRERCAELVAADRVVAVSAQPKPMSVLVLDPDGNERQELRERPADLEALREAIWKIVEHDGKTLAALNASLFAADLSDKVGVRLVAARSELAERLVRTYCIGKGIAVGLNPVPVADLLAAAAIDVGMIMHLSQVFGLPMSRNDAGKLVSVISGEALALMGTLWAAHVISSALKVGSGGLSTALTAGAQSAIAYYGTYVVGQVAREYLAAGKSWGEAGPKQTVRRILSSIDRESVLATAREDIRARLGR